MSGGFRVWASLSLDYLLYIIVLFLKWKRNKKSCFNLNSLTHPWNGLVWTRFLPRKDLVFTDPIYFYFFFSYPREPPESKTTDVTRIYNNILVQRHERFFFFFFYYSYYYLSNTQAIDDLGWCRIHDGVINYYR